MDTVMETASGDSLAPGQTVDVLLAGEPTYRGRLMVLRPGHARPYVVQVETYHGPNPQGSLCGRVVAFHSDQIRRIP